MGHIMIGKQILFVAVLALALAFVISCGEGTFSAYNPITCGGKTYNSSEHSCVVVAECNGLYYNPDYQICNGGRIENLAGSSGSGDNNGNGSQSGGGSSGSDDNNSSGSQSGDGSSGSDDNNSSGSQSGDGSSGSGDNNSSGSQSGGGSSSSGSAQCTGWTDWVTEIPATCDNDGKKTRTCKSGISKTETEVIPQYVWGEWEITPATPGAHGEAKRTCENGDVETEEVLKCGDKEYAKDEQRCGIGNVIENKCGADGWYDKSNAELRCHNDVIETSCGSSWYDATDANLKCESNVLKNRCGTGDNWYNPSTQFCQSGTNTVQNLCDGQQFDSNQKCDANKIVTSCGSSWYDATNTNLKCESNVVKNKCGTSSWYNPSTEFCQSSSGTGTVKTLCNGKTFTSSQRCQNNVVETSCGSSWYDATNTNLRCQNNVVESKCGSNWYNPSTEICDTRDNNVYKFTVINGQTWMAQNLNYATNGSCGNGSSGSSLTTSNTTTCNTYGRLYTWANAKNACPSGWSLPTADQWTTLTDHIGGTSQGAKLKATSGWNGSMNGTDNYGFKALPGGYGDTGKFYGSGLSNENMAYWWTATENGNNAYHRAFLGTNTINTSSSNKTSYLYSVRCIKN